MLFITVFKPNLLFYKDVGLFLLKTYITLRLSKRKRIFFYQRKKLAMSKGSNFTNFVNKLSQTMCHLQSNIVSRLLVQRDCKTNRKKKFASRYVIMSFFLKQHLSLPIMVCTRITCKFAFKKKKV